ncbi:MAG TPA: dihydrolipoamide acetyltransferase family protein, partial [Caldilineaceae bacterium]|nr:dihydrolipoamide acetyltransferase family protein [Caldilineaceae bacterium]
AAGTLLEVLVGEGTTVRAGAVLAYIAAADEQPAITPAPAHPAVVAAEAAPAPATALPASSPAVAARGARPRGDEKPSGRAFISPVVARIAAEHQIDLGAVPGSGLGGRITKKDILAYVARRVEQPASPAVAPAGEAPWDGQEAWLQPLDAMRRAIAQHMVRSKQTSPHVTTVFEVDMTAVVLHREAHKAAFAQKGLRLTFTPYFVAAAAQALRQVPEANARFYVAGEGGQDDGGQSGILFQRRIHIGIAVSLPNGLIVPVIRDADEKNLQGLARAVAEAADAARNGRLSPDATRGGTFTITNHGVTGSLIGTPIINQPQAGILGIGAIAKRPVVRSGSASLLPSADDAIVIRPMCYLSFSFDHRVLDGAKADAFVAAVKERLEKWPSDQI